MDFAGLAELERVPVGQIPEVLGRLEAVQAALWLKLRAAQSPGGRSPLVPDDYVAIEEAARLVHRSVRWMQKHGRTLPGFRQPKGRGTRVEWGRRALLRYGGSPA